MESGVTFGINLLGIFGALGMGLSLGLFGAGGSILTLPILVYLYSVQPLLATQLSLLVVGVVSLSGVFRNFRNLQWLAAAGFTAGILFGMAIMRRGILPILPRTIWEIPLDQWILVFFALVMIAASLSMMFVKVRENPGAQSLADKIGLIFLGILIGLLTGFVGAGGGFLIVPALVFLGKLEMKQATATSLLVIAANSLTGFGVSPNFSGIPWSIVLEVLGFALIGMQLGQRLAGWIPAHRLKQAFGLFVLAMGSYILLTAKGS